MRKLVIVSNRLPVTVKKTADGFEFIQSVGGLATALSSFYEKNGIWIGWPGIVKDELENGDEEYLRDILLNKYKCIPVFLSKEQLDKYYYGFCNEIIWPLSHDFPQYVKCQEKFFDTYLSVNQFFADKVLENVGEEDVIWINDYHLLLLSQMIRERCSNSSIIFFLHIPFPSDERFCTLPWRKEILKGMLGADVVGFQIYKDVRNFSASILKLLGYEFNLGQINTGHRIIHVGAFPIGIDYNKFANNDGVCDSQGAVDCKIILSVDRLDYTKGIPERLNAYNIFLGKFPEYKGKVQLVIIAVPTRPDGEAYINLKKQTDEIVGAINGDHSTDDWEPVKYFFRSFKVDELIKHYRNASVCTVTPLKDGMNLIAKEVIAAHDKDKRIVLILSEFAGAAEELRSGALVVNPYDQSKMIEALKKGLTMPESEQIERAQIMQKRIRHYDVHKWITSLLDSLKKTKEVQEEMSARILSADNKEKLIRQFKKSFNTLILLGSDGVIMPYESTFERVSPSNELILLLEKLQGNQRNQIVLIGGREKHTFGKWFGESSFNFIAEGGVWYKFFGQEWIMIELLNNEWKENVRPALQLAADLVPGASMEEKEYSMSWHWRGADPKQGFIKAQEIKAELLHLIGNLSLCLVEGNKVVEIKNAGVNIGRTALKFIEKNDWDFILAIGRDTPFEDLFGVLPDNSYSINVGLTPSRAKFSITSTKDVVAFLEALVF
ncbi:bifunctional alpha,alpha-trehalose-phosphate synthase (UDP-forming)/trehalose-phosphatase [Patescibacteria group bacterium]